MGLAPLAQSARPLIALAALAAACAGQGAAGSTTADRPDRTLPSSLETVPRSSSTAGLTGEVPAALLAAVLADVSARTGVAPDAATIVTAESTTWPDGSLGCPRPGETHRPVPTPGYRVVVEVAGDVYDYHLTAAGLLRLCASPGPPSG
jgi:hypothetical protein